MSHQALGLEDLYAEVADAIGVTERDCRRVIIATMEAMAGALGEGRTIKVRNFGKFTIRQRKARIGHNPLHPDELVELPAHNVVFFKPCADLKRAVIRTPLV